MAGDGFRGRGGAGGTRRQERHLEQSGQVSDVVGSPPQRLYLRQLRVRRHVRDARAELRERRVQVRRAPALLSRR